MTIFNGTEGRYVTFEQTGTLWTVVLKSSTAVIDKVRCDDYRQAVEYRKAFLKIARSQEITMGNGALGAPTSTNH